MKSLKGKHILVTGITGFVGSALAKQLEKKGAHVYGISRNEKGKHILQADITNYTQLERIIKKYHISVCFHLAAEALVESGQKDPYKTFYTNTQGTLNILELARIYAFEKVIIASSSHVYGKNIVPYKEYYPPKPSRPYETSKACTDLIAQSYADTFNLPVLIARSVNIYGPGDIHFTRLIPKTIRAVLSGEEPTMWGGGALREYLYISDALEAYIKLALLPSSEMKKNRIYNLGSGQLYSVKEVIQKIILLSNKTVAIKHIEDKRELEIKSQYVSSLKAKRILHWEAKTSLESGLVKTIAWYIQYLK